MSAIVGREAELEQVDRFLTSVASGAHGLHLHGEAGIGKSTIWQRTLALAGERGFRIVSSRPTEAEARLPLAGLNDLFGALFDELGETLPEPQRRALGGALLRADVGDASPEPLAISLAVLALVRAAAEQRPLLVAVDDVPWLDESSASVLEFLVRRLDAEPVGVALAERTQPGAGPGRRLIEGMPVARVTEIRVQPMARADIDRLLSATLGLGLPPSTLARLHRASGGNPFYAVEIGRALQRHATDAPDGELPVPETLSELLRERLDALSVAATDLVEHASGLSQPRAAQLTALLGAETVEAGLSEAVAANIVVVDGDLVRFTHPLLAAELYQDLPDGRRKDLHRRLAEVVVEPEEHARHMALAADGPDEAVAAELERAAERAYARGAPDAAADLASRAADLTPGRDERIRRWTLTARYQVRAGDAARARATLEAALTEAPTGPPRAAVLLQLGEVRALMDDWRAAETHLDEALEHVGDDIRLEIDIRLQRGGVSFITAQAWGAGAEHAREAMRLAEDLGDESVIARTIGPYITWSHVTGSTIPVGLEERVAALEPWTAHLRLLDHPRYDLTRVLVDAGDRVTALANLEGLLERAERSGDYSSIPFLLAFLADLDFHVAEPERGFERLERADRLARTTGQTTALVNVDAARTTLLARLGRADEAWRSGREGLTTMDRIGFRAGAPKIRMELGRLEMSRRDPQAALAVLEPFGVMPGTGDVAWIWWKGPVHLEALIGLGRLDEARVLLDGWMRLAPMRDSPHRMRHIVRAGALLAAATGDLDEATRLLAEAETAFTRFDAPWGRARTALIAGEIHRRARRRAMARDAFASAVRDFERLGARLWAAYAREELQRVGAPREEGAALTPTQSQVADLVTQGLTNRQVGDRLFMSPHTVEAHLTAIYRALGIRSRAELADALRASTPAASPRDPEATPRDSTLPDAGNS